MKRPTFSRIIIVISLLFLGVQSYAQSFVPFTPRFNQDVRGDIALIGNNILGPNNNPFNDSTRFNHTVNMRYIDIDGDPSTFSSSSADLTIPNPNCYRIIYAALYWGGVTKGDEPIEEVRFQGPTGGYVDVTGTVIYDADDVVTAQSFPYSCFADVTDIVTNLGTNLGTYTVANVSSAEGRTRDFGNTTGFSAGWSLFVVYEDPTLTGKSITSFDGFSAISRFDPPVPVTISGFRTVPAPTPVRATFAFAALEGDSPIRGDGLMLNGTSISTVDRPVNNFFNSSVTQLSALPVNNRVPNSTNTLGFDTGVMVIPNPGNSVIANNATSAVVDLGTVGDTYFPYFFALSVEIIEPNIVLTKTVEDDSGNDIGGQVIGLGAPLNYVIGFQNTGNDNATNFQIRDILPINIIFDFPGDLVLPAGVTVSSYDPVTRELIFDIEDFLVEEGDPVGEIRIEARVVDTCNQLADACSNLIDNQAFARYNGFFNPNFEVTDDPSLNSNTGCLLTPQATNFLADLDDCTFEQEVVLCGDSVDLTAANGYDAYSWSTSPTGTPVIATTQTITVTETGTYYVDNLAIAPCQSIQQEFNVQLFGGASPNPVIPFADEVVTCPNDGELLPNIFLCGANTSRNIQTNIADSISIIWERLDESSCPAVLDQDCANEDGSCTWNQVATGSDFLADTSGQYRVTINYPGGCFVQHHFNVFQNLLNPTATATDIVCTTPGSITVGNVPSDYEYSLDGVTYQASNMFPIATAGLYTIFIRQIGVNTNPCVFTVPDVQVRERDFTVSTTVTQPLCNGERGSIQLAANDADPQYFFSLSRGGALVNSVGPIIENNFTFENLNPGTYTATVTTEDGCTYTDDITIIEPPLLTATSALTTPLTCTDGEITVFPVGGTPPYFYFVNSTTDFQTVPEIIVTVAGVYNITVVDSNNCSTSTSITVTQTPEPDFTIDSINILCASNSISSGRITINVTNPNGNSLQYSIDGGATFSNSPIFAGLIAGDYDVVVQYTTGSSVCVTDPQTRTITTAPPITGTAALTTPYTCTTNGVITVSGVSGGTPPYSYSIDGFTFQPNTTFSGLTDGTYTITIRDASDCTFVTNQVIIDPLNPPTDLMFSNSPLSCPSIISTITITGTTGGVGALEYQIIAPTADATAYQPSTDFPNLSPGTYTFQVRDANDCVYSESYTIEPLPTSTVSAVLTKGLDCTPTPDAVITGTITGPAPYTYAVSINGGAFTPLGATGSPFVYTASTAGTYQFEVTDANGCTALSTVQTINPIIPPNIDLLQTQPILCNGNSSATIQVIIDGTVGTPPFVINVNNDTTGVNFGTQTTGLPAGNYTVTITDVNSCADTETIIITEPALINVINPDTIDITCGASGVSQGAIVIDGVTGGTPPYDYFITGTNGFSFTELDNPGTVPFSLNVLDFGLYQINVVDANGCSVLIQDLLVASPPTDLDIIIDPTVDCLTGGEALISIGSTLTSTGPFFFDIYQGFIPAPPPGGTWIPEDAPMSQQATITNLIPGVTYTFIVFDVSTGCSYFEPATIPIPTSSTLTATAVSPNNITCTGSADGNVSFTVNSIYTTATNIDYEIFNSLSVATTGISGSGVVPAGGSLPVNNLGPLPVGNYFVIITETSGPNAGCGTVTAPFNITESQILLSLSTSIIQNANCNADSGIINAIAMNGTPPYSYQITTTAIPPLPTDPAWDSANTFGEDAGSYYVHVRDANNCIQSSPVAIDLMMDPTPVISAVLDDQCSTEEGVFEINVTLTTAGTPPYSFSIDGGAFQTRTIPFTLSNLSSGPHSIQINDANGCGNTELIDIAPPITLTPEVTALPTCNNDDGEITVTGIGGTGSYTYTISPTAASISLTGNVFSGVPSGTYTVTITDAVTMCSDDAMIVLPEATVPTVTTNPTDVVCFGDTSTFELNVSGYSGPYNYEVFDSLGVSVFGIVAANTSTNPEIVTGILAGSYTVTVTETASPFCATTNSVIIGSPPEALTLSATETSNVTCNNGQGTITAIANGGSGIYEYELIGPISEGYSSNNTFRNLIAGVYTVNVRDSRGCIVPDNVTLSLPTPITATFTPNTTLLSCFGDQNAIITISNVTGGQGANYTYTLNTILPTASTSGPQTSNEFGDLGAGTYSVTINDGLECNLTSQNIVIAEPTPVEASLVTATTQTCLTQSALTLSASGGTGPYTYSDDINFATTLGTFVTSTTFSVPAGTYVYYIRDANNCTSDVSNEITIEDIPALTINLESENPTINCAGDNTGIIIATAIGGLGNYVYELQDGSGNPITTAIQNTPGVFSELTAGNYIVTVTSGDCTPASEPVTITEPTTSLNAAPIVNNVTCSGANDGSIIVNASGGTGNIQYSISPQSNQFFETNNFEDLAPGNYQIIVQDILGCFMTFDVTIVEPDPVLVSIDSILPEVCEGDVDGEFSIDIIGGTPPYSVSLDDINGPYTAGTLTQTRFDFTGLAGGDHIVYVRDNLNCESEWNITFPESVNIAPIVDVEYICENNVTTNTVTVTVDVSITDLSDLDYSLNGGPYQADNVFRNLTSGTGYFIDVRHTNGCIQRTEVFDILEFEPLTLTLSEGGLNEIVATTTGGTGIYQYTFNGQDQGTRNTFIINETGTYTVIVTDSSGCMAVATIDIEFIDICVPDVFTPNGDGIADGFAPGCSENFPNLEFDIFDRYGRKVATLRQGEFWDGTYNGSELPTGDYWYVVRPNSPTINRSDFVGHFTLYR